jgi:hypothetical protein
MVRHILLASLLASGLVQAQSADDATREIQRLKTQYDEERKGASIDSSRQAQWRSQGRERLAAMRTDARRLSRERDSLRGALEQEGKPKPPPPPPVAPATVRKKAFAEALAREIDRTLPLLSLEARDLSATGARWATFSKELRAGSEDPETVLGQFLDDLSERIDAAGRITARPGSWTDSTGRVVRGRWIEVGGAALVFAGNDGTSAVAGPGGKLRPVSDPSVRDALARSGRVLAGEDPPSWIFLPAGGAP